MVHAFRFLVRGQLELVHHDVRNVSGQNPAKPPPGGSRRRYQGGGAGPAYYSNGSQSRGRHDCDGNSWQGPQGSARGYRGTGGRGNGNYGDWWPGARGQSDGYGRSSNSGGGDRWQERQQRSRNGEAPRGGRGRGWRRNSGPVAEAASHGNDSDVEGACHGDGSLAEGVCRGVDPLAERACRGGGPVAEGACHGDDALTPDFLATEQNAVCCRLVSLAS